MLFCFFVFVFFLEVGWILFVTSLCLEQRKLLILLWNWHCFFLINRNIPNNTSTTYKFNKATGAIFDLLSIISSSDPNMNFQKLISYIDTAWYRYHALHLVTLMGLAEWENTLSYLYSIQFIIYNILQLAFFTTYTICSVQIDMRIEYV